MIQPSLDHRQPAPLYYSFAIGGIGVGWFEIADDGEEIRMCATFEMGGERYDNPFALRYDGDRVLAWRAGGDDWTDNPEPERLYPSCAYPLLVPLVVEALRYDQVVEGSGEIVAGVVLQRAGDQVTESKLGVPARRFWFDHAGTIVRIDWGGALSELRDGPDAAKAGSPFA